MKDHRLIDERSLAFGRAVAAKIAADPALVDLARANLTRWLETVSPRTRPALLEWRAILDGPPDQLLTLLRSSEERAVRLRQSSPFAGALSTAERTAILTEFQRREATAA